MRDNNILDRIKTAVTQTDPNATAILFGSRATGKATEESDWDILILVDKEQVSLKEEQVFRHNLFDIGLDIGQHISTFVYGKTDWNTRHIISPLYASIAKEGILL